MSSTYLTWVKVCKFHGIKQGTGPDQWKLNGQYHYIEFGNGSRIDLLDVKFLPSDPLYERFGSQEFTDGALEECGEIDFRAFDVLKSRVGRHRNDEFGIRPTLALTGNPKKNWTRSTFYTPWVKGTLPEGYAFIQSLYSDNTYTAELYEKSLSGIIDKTLRERLKEGNWDYEDDAGVIFNYEAITDLWTNHLAETNGKYLSVDVAREGKDKTVFYFWRGFQVYKKEVYRKQDTAVTSLKLKEFARSEGIPFSRIIVDEDGVGGGVVDNCRGVHGFVNNSSPLPNENPKYEYLEKTNFANLKTQCAWIMAQKTNRHEVSIEVRDDIEFIESLNQELSTYKISHSEDDQRKMKLESKEEQTKLIGRSPDYGDAFIMRGFFELKREFRALTKKQERDMIQAEIDDAMNFDPHSVL